MSGRGWGWCVTEKYYVYILCLEHYPIKRGAFILWVIYCGIKMTAFISNSSTGRTRRGSTAVLLHTEEHFRTHAVQRSQSGVGTN